MHMKQFYNISSQIASHFHLFIIIHLIIQHNSSLINTIKSVSRVGWMANAACLSEPFKGRYTYIWQDNIKIDLRETEWIWLAQHSQMVQFCILPQHYMASQLRRHRLESSPAWKSQILHVLL